MLRCSLFICQSKRIGYSSVEFESLQPILDQVVRYLILMSMTRNGERNFVAERKMRIALIGDIALFGCNNKNNYYKERFKKVKEYLSSFDYVIGNLETPLTEETKIIGGKSAYIKGKPADVEILKYLGITHISLANNHTFDYCEKGLRQTKESLSKYRIKWYGSQGKTEEIIDAETKIKLHGFCCYSTNGKGMGDYIDIFDPIKVEQDILNDQRGGYLPILSIHWGQEHVHYPNYDHVLMARKLALKAPFIIHGHHPHVLQGVENIERSLIAYSLGNFCFDDVYTNKSAEPLIKLSDDNKEVMVLGIEIIGNEIKNMENKYFTFDKKNYKEAPYIKEKAKTWNAFMKKEENEYKDIRQKELSKYIEGRKKIRDLQWYLKRMNAESVRMIVSNQKNQKEYDRLIRGYIKER